MITFAEEYKSFPDGQQNVGEPPEEILSEGFVPETRAARGMPLPAQWLNWLFQKAFRLIGRDNVSNAAGVGLFKTAESFIRLEAFDRADPAKYLIAVGYKAGINDAHVLHVVSSSVLTLGTATGSGNQPILGGVNVVVSATSRNFGEI